MDVFINTSAGELLDKISILQIKREKIKHPEKLLDIEKELSILTEIVERNMDSSQNWIFKLKEINEKLWEIEDKIRLKEKFKDFNQEFIDLARAVYINNDERFKIKNEINSIYNSSIKEQKSYEEYK